MEKFQKELIAPEQNSETAAAKEPLAYVYERDLDLLFAEEFYSSPAFAKWFGDQILKNLTKPENFSPPREKKEHKLNPAKFSEVSHSVVATGGETDVLAIYQTDAGKEWLVLIENKINVGFQELQPERYYIRAEDLAKKRQADGYSVVLIAPLQYFKKSKSNYEFEAAISYEDVRDWFIKESNLGERARYKAAILNLAIEKKGKNPGVPKVNIFCQAYDKFLRSVQAEFKDVILLSNLQAPRSDIWINYNLPTDIAGKNYIVHKAEDGVVGLYFSGEAANYEKINQRYAKWLTANNDTGLAINKANKSLSLTLKVPKLSIEVDFAEQQEKAREAFQAITKLVEIYRSEYQQRSDH